MSTTPLKDCDELLGYCELIVTDSQLREIRVNRSGFKKLNSISTREAGDIKWKIAGFGARNIKWTSMGWLESLAGGSSKFIFTDKESSDLYKNNNS